MNIRKQRDIRSYAHDVYDVKTIKLGSWSITIGYKVGRFKKEWSFRSVVKSWSELYNYTHVFKMRFKDIEILREKMHLDAGMVYAIFTDYERKRKRAKRS